LTEAARKKLHKSEIMWMRLRMSYLERLIAPFERPVRIAKSPKIQAQIRERIYPGVAEKDADLPVALRIIKG
jgi:hypothetical protein